MLFPELFWLAKQVMIPCLPKPNLLASEDEGHTVEVTKEEIETVVIQSLYDLQRHLWIEMASMLACLPFSKHLKKHVSYSNLKSYVIVKSRYNVTST